MSVSGVAVGVSAVYSSSRRHGGRGAVARVASQRQQHGGVMRGRAPDTDLSLLEVAERVHHGRPDQAVGGIEMNGDGDRLCCSICERDGDAEGILFNSYSLSSRLIIRHGRTKL